MEELAGRLSWASSDSHNCDLLAGRDARRAEPPCDLVVAGLQVPRWAGRHNRSSVRMNMSEPMPARVSETQVFFFIISDLCYGRGVYFKSIIFSG